MLLAHSVLVYFVCVTFVSLTISLTQQKSSLVHYLFRLAHQGILKTVITCMLFLLFHEMYYLAYVCCVQQEFESESFIIQQSYLRVCQSFLSLLLCSLLRIQNRRKIFNVLVLI